MAPASPSRRSARAIVVLSSLLCWGTALANHYILPCADECADARWTPTGSMHGAREWHTATLLPDGTVLVAGGRNGATPIDAAELYDPGSGTWRSVASMSVPRSFHTATLLDDGRVLVAGGAWLGAGSDHASAEIYDPATGSWTATGGMVTARSSHAAVRLADGRVLVAGGWDGDVLASAEIYDPATARWSATGPMSRKRYGLSLTALHDGTVLAVRGTDSGDLMTTLSSAEVYDPSSGTWSAAGDSGAGSVMHTATALADGRVLVTGGNGGGIGRDTVHALAMLFDPATRRWQRVADLDVPRYGHAATALPDGGVVVAGGAFQRGAYPALRYENLASTERFDPIELTWSGDASLVDARSGLTLTTLHDGSLLAVGGAVVGPELAHVPLARAERYEASLAKGSVTRKAGGGHGPGGIDAAAPWAPIVGSPPLR